MSQHFPVENYVLFLERPDELAVRKSFGPKSRVYPDVPKLAEIIFSVAPMGKSVFASVSKRLVGLSLLFTPAETITFHFGEDIPAGFESVNSLFNS